MATVFDVADYFLAWQDEEAGDLISNLKLQKLCYYAQGFTLAVTGAPLFQEEIQAWGHGPVCPVLYQKYKGYESKALPVPERPLSEIITAFNAEQLDVLQNVRILYGQFSAWKLRDFTHKEAPWMNAYTGGVVCHAPISHEAMRNYFLTQVEV